MTGDRGAASVMMFIGVAMVALLSVVVASVGTLYAARTQAQTASDAAALAAAVSTYPMAGGGSPSTVARAVAGENGAHLVSCRCPPDAAMVRRAVEVVTSVDVTVPVFGRLQVKASSRAEFDPRSWLGR